LKRRSGPTSVSPCLAIHSVTIGKIENKSVLAPISFFIEQSGEPKIVDTKALIDCGAGGKFIDQNYARRLGLKQLKLKKPLPVYNIDGTRNKQGTI